LDNWEELVERIGQPQHKYAATAFPIVGGYIIFLDIINISIWKMALLYLSLLIIALSVWLFEFFCPPIIKKFQDFDSFQSKFAGTERDQERIDSLTKQKFILENGETWRDAINRIWDSEKYTGLTSRKIIVRSLFVGGIGLKLYGIFAIFDVISAIASDL